MSPRLESLRPYSREEIGDLFSVMGWVSRELTFPYMYYRPVGRPHLVVRGAHGGNSAIPLLGLVRSPVLWGVKSSFVNLFCHSDGESNTNHNTV